MAGSSRPERLGDAEIESALERIPGWMVRGGKLHREFRFRNFDQAFGFMTRAALCSEVMNHHPEWSNVYATVVVDLVTHSAEGHRNFVIPAARYQISSRMWAPKA